MYLPANKNLRAVVQPDCALSCRNEPAEIFFLMRIVSNLCVFILKPPVKGIDLRLILIRGVAQPG
jgi:hypothetical protein